MALSAQQQFFVEEYLRTFNATDSYMAAYPNAKRNTATSNGYRLLKENPEIIELVQVRLSEAAMSADEVLARLAAEARGDIDDFLDDDGNFDLDKARKAKKTGLIKKLKTKTTTRTVGEMEVKTTEVEFELYDAQAAKALLGKHHKLFVERQEVTGADGGAIRMAQEHDLSKLSLDELIQLRAIVAKTDATTEP